MAGKSSKVGSERLAALLSERREALGMSRRDLAERSGLSYPYVSQLETAYRLPSPRAMHALAHALQLPASDLFEALPDAQLTGSLPPPGSAEPRRGGDQWMANPVYAASAPPELPSPARDELPPSRPGPARRGGERARAVQAAVTALEMLHADERLDALHEVQSVVVHGVVREQRAES